MKRRTVRSATLIGLAGGVAALTLVAAPAASAAPAAISTCDTYVAGGLVRTLIQRTGDNLTIRTSNISAPRAVVFDYDKEVALGGLVWRGPTGTIPYHGSARTWYARGVFPIGSQFLFQVHDARGNTGGARCDTWR